MMRMAVRRPLGMLALAFVALLLNGRSVGQSAGAVTEFERRLTVAANAGDVEALAALSVGGGPERFQWVTHRGLMGSAGPWTVRVIGDPGPEADPTCRWVSFSRYLVCESEGDRLFRLAEGPDGLRMGAETPETDIGGYRVRHHDLAVRFDVPNCRVRIADQLLIERRPGAWSAAVLRLNSPYVLDAVRVGGRAAPYQRAGGFLVLHAPAGERFTVDLAYGAQMEGHAEDYIRPDHAALTSYWYPHTGRLPATSRVAVTAPASWRGISVGNLVGREEHGGEATTTFENPAPVCYLTVAAGDYHVTSRVQDGVQINAYLLTTDPARAAGVVGVAGKALSWFSRNLSTYPYRAYTVVESRSFPAALECYSFTLCGSSTIPSAVPHEVSHTWWGGVVPNTYTHSLWNESFATYSDALYRRSTAARPESLTDAAANPILLAAASGVSLLEARDAMDLRQSAVGYGKGGAVLREFERMVGKEKVLASMRRFIEKHRPGEDADWPDYVDAVAEAVGPEWRGFFDAWLPSVDLPQLRLENVKATSDGSQYVVRGEIGFAGPAFWLSVPVAVSTQAGDVTVDVAVKGAVTPFAVKTSARPTRLRVDPGNQLLRKRASVGRRPTLANLQTSSAPLLIVYATGGSPQAADAARAAATASAKTAFAFAPITVKADGDVTGNDLDGSNVLILGRSEDLRLPKEWASLSPIRADDGAVRVGSDVFRGAGVWGLAILPHPTRADGFAAFACGVGVDALSGLARLGDLDPDRSCFVVDPSGKPLLQKRAEAPGELDVELSVSP